MLVLADKYLSSSELMVARGIGIILMGDFGTGKTLTATLILKHLLHGGYSVYSTTFANMIEMFTAGWYDAAEKEFYHERVRKSEILLIDDIGKEYKTKSGLGSATFDSILRSRVQDGRPTFITTNMSLEEMKEGYGSAILSLLQETSLVQEVAGRDYRERAGNSKLQEILNGLQRPII
jgi:DNA replication protein DnaC